MKVHSHPGFFIDIEGLDGSGMSTQVNLVRERLLKKGYKAYKTSEPTDNVVGGLIRGALSGVYKLPPEALQLLFVADRSHHVDREIAPILSDGNILVADRFLWSTIAFGSVDLSRQWLLQLHRYCFLPDLSIFLRVSPGICVKRLEPDRFNFELFEKEDKLRKTWKTYEWLAKKFPQLVKIVEGEQGKEKVTREILRQIRLHPKFKQIERRKK